MGSLITMNLIVKMFKEIPSCSLYFVIILPCNPGYTMSNFHVSFPDQIECAILSSPGRVVCATCINLPWFEKTREKYYVL
jgi:hypothetical protein